MNISSRVWLAVSALSFLLQGTAVAETIPRGSAPPIVLINGWQTLCTSSDNTITAAGNYFGLLPAFLGNTGGYTVLFFNTCQYVDSPIETIAAGLNTYLANLTYTDGATVPQVDIIAHGMGGLVARAYLAGKGQTSGSFSPPANPKVRKLILIATPNFGATPAENTHGIQEAEMALGSQFLWDLATWNQNQDDLRGVDALAIVGSGGTLGNAPGGSDGFVSVTSASLGFARPDIRTRIIGNCGSGPCCHVTSANAPAGFPLSCIGTGIAQVDNTSTHPTALIVLAFLSDSPQWQGFGVPPSQDIFFSQFGGIGGVILTLKAADNTYFRDITVAGYDCTGTRCNGHLGSGPSSSVASVYANEVVQLGQRTFVMTRADASTISQTATVLAGRTNAFAFKLGPAITSVQSSVSTGLPGLTVSGNSNITVTGSGFMSANTQLFANTTPLTISSVTDIQITAFLPGGFNGLVPIKVTTPSGQHTINILTASASPVMTVTSVGNGGSGAEGAIAPGEIIQIKGSLLGPSTGVSFSINAQGKVDTILGGVRVLFGTIAAPITYASAAQVNAIVPYEVAGTSVVMKVEYQGVQSAGTTLQVASAAPGVFTFNATGTGQAIAYNLADGSFNGPNAAVAKSGSVAVYFTGGGQTTPPGETGSVNGSTLKVIPPQNLFVTVGGKQVISAAAAAAPTLVDGVQQLNIQIAPNTPSGAQPLVISVNGISSPSTATLSVQ